MECSDEFPVWTKAQRAEVMLCKATASPAARKRMTGDTLIDVFGGSGFLGKATNHLGLRGYVLDTQFGLRYDATQPFFSPDFDKTFPVENVSQG